MVSPPVGIAPAVCYTLFLLVTHHHYWLPRRCSLLEWCGILSLISGYTFYNCIVQPETRVACPGDNQLRQSRDAQPTVHAGCFSVPIIHRTLTWTTGSITCTQMLMHAIAHGGCTDTRKRVCTES